MAVSLSTLCEMSEQDFDIAIERLERAADAGDGVARMVVNTVDAVCERYGTFEREFLEAYFAEMGLV